MVVGCSNTACQVCFGPYRTGWDLPSLQQPSFPTTQTRGADGTLFYYPSVYTTDSTATNASIYWGQQEWQDLTLPFSNHTTNPYVPVKRVLPRARARARRLLKGKLDDFQRHSLKKRGYFDVVSESGKLYRVKTGMSRNVYLLDAKGREVENLCAYVTGDCPDFDTMLMQKLMLECNEQEFRRLANRWTKRDGLWVPAAA